MTCNVYEIYFKEKIDEGGLKTNLLGLVEPLKDVENLKTEEEKLKVVKEEWGEDEQK